MSDLVSSSQFVAICSETSQNRWIQQPHFLGSNPQQLRGNTHGHMSSSYVIGRAGLRPQTASRI